MRTVGVTLAALLLLTGCDDAGAHPQAAPSTAPAAAAGGACQLLDFAVVNAKLGLDLAVAASATQDNTFTCVLQPRAATAPDLVLSVSATTIGADIYTSAVQPKGAAPVEGLGAAAYQQPTPATDGTGHGTGPGAEVGWLAGNKRIIQLSVHLASGTPEDKSAELLPKLVALAKLIDLSSL
ncbi:hypothetical protein AB0K00_34805 [Dactylosporangium sp. NPDC049525]|uniref:hypothetical protein n=1 Tax=Dactylosporangium sp. NPDC049525 TaxID=3154730 RepID=UPI003423E073